MEKEKIDFILKLGHALHSYGTAAHRLEQALVMVSQKLGLDAQFMSMPTAIVASFKTQDGETSRLIRVQPGDVHLEKLALIDRLGDDVIDNRLTPREGARRIDEIIQSPNRYPDYVTPLCFAASSAAIAAIFRAGWIDLGVAAGVGGVIGVLAAYGTRLRRVERTFEAVAAFLAAFLTFALASVIPAVSTQLVILASLVVLLPGLSITIGIAELSTLNLVAGTARLMGAAMVLLKLGVGVALGTRLAGIVLSYDPSPVLALRVPSWMEWVGVVAAGSSLIVLFRAHPRDAIWILVAGILGFGGSRMGAAMLGPDLGVLLGGCLIGAASNVFARSLQRPASILHLPGIILLVPGSVGFRSLAFMFEREVVTGMDTAFQMVVTAAALVAGLFLGNVIVQPRRIL